MKLGYEMTFFVSSLKAAGHCILTAAEKGYKKIDD
jgi:hypothetical protein